jgi:hypothetical protein
METTMKTLIFLFGLMVAPAFAQYKTYSDWVPSNEIGVQYRWVVDDLYPRACTVQFRDLDKDGASLLRVSIHYRNFSHPASVALQVPVTTKNGESKERILLSCTFLDQVVIEHTLRR